MLDKLQALKNVEYHSIFTSNHNNLFKTKHSHSLNIIPFLHQTTTQEWREYRLDKLNIIPFLHQTTTFSNRLSVSLCWISFHFYIKPQLSIAPKYSCSSWISFHFYIKPQHKNLFAFVGGVEYHSIFASNHNGKTLGLRGFCVEYHSIFTSNHNSSRSRGKPQEVEYHSIFTSNHNLGLSSKSEKNVEYHSIFTSNHNITRENSKVGFVEYHSIFTSNHNSVFSVRVVSRLNIIPFLHQTTTTITLMLPR